MIRLYQRSALIINRTYRHAEAVHVAGKARDLFLLYLRRCNILHVALQTHRSFVNEAWKDQQCKWAEKSFCHDRKAASSNVQRGARSRDAKYLLVYRSSLEIMEFFLYKSDIINDIGTLSFEYELFFTYNQWYRKSHLFFEILWTFDQNVFPEWSQVTSSSYFVVITTV